MKRIMIRECKSEDEVERGEKVLLRRARRRSIANLLERRRVRRLNQAFSLLRETIPYCDARRIRTKLDVLRYAIEYIRLLRIMARVDEVARGEPQGANGGRSERGGNKSTNNMLGMVHEVFNVA